MNAQVDVETKAKELGWAPKEEFRGDEKNWVDAETYVRRGEEVMPILRKNNAKLNQELESTKGKLTALEQALAASQASIKELKEFNTSISQEKAEQIKKELQAELVAAKREGDFEKEVLIGDQLDEHREAMRKAEPKADEPKVEPKVTESDAVVAAKAEFTEWAAENSWYNTDPVKTGLANGIAQKLRKDGSPLTGKAFYAEVAKQVETFGGRQAPKNDKVEGGGRGTGQGGGGSQSVYGKTYGDLPEEAKAACEKFVRKGDVSVGKGKTFETIEAWRTHYATKYFERE